jgi:hypothetical protein
MARIHAENEEKIEGLMEAAHNKIRLEVKKSEWASMGRTLLLQSNVHAKEFPSIACRDSLRALTNFALAEDEYNISAAMHMFGETVGKVYSADLQLCEIEECSQEAIEALQSLNANRRYQRDLTEIRLEIANAQKRTREAKAP